MTSGAGRVARTAPPDGLSWIAGVIRSGRSGKYSLEQLAARSGLSAGLLSQIERGRGNPSLGTLEKIANALGLPLGEFFRPQERREEGPAVVRAGKRARLAVPPSGRTYELLTPYPHSTLAVLRTVIEPTQDGQAPSAQHAGDEFVLVIRGTLSVEVDGVVFRLDPGDSITYSSTATHSWRSDTDALTEIIAVRVPPGI